MFKIVIGLCALSGVAAAQIQLGGSIRIGGNKPPQQQQQPQQQPGRQEPTATAPGKPAEPAENRAATDAWRAVQRDYGHELDRLYDYTTRVPTGPNSSNQTVEAALADLKNVAKLEPIKTGCANHTYEGGRYWVSHNDAFMVPKTICPLVDRAEEIYKTALRAWARSYGESFVASLKGNIERLEKDKQVSLDDAITGITAERRRAYVASFVKKYFEALGEPVPEDLLAKVDELVVQEKKVIDDAAAAGKPEKIAGHDAGAERAIADAYKARHKGIQIKKVYLIDAAWHVKQNNIGLITNRYKSGTALVKIKDTNNCIILPAAVGQAYAGGGRYASTYDVDDYLSGAPLRCK